MRSTEQKMFKGISRWQRSGLSQKAWCEKNNIAYAGFHYWYKRYRVNKVMTTGKVDEGRFVQLVMDSSKASEWWCEIQLAMVRNWFFAKR